MAYLQLHDQQFPLPDLRFGAVTAISLTLAASGVGLVLLLLTTVR
jgi:hypothetical protein